MFCIRNLNNFAFNVKKLLVDKKLFGNKGYQVCERNHNLQPDTGKTFMEDVFFRPTH